MWEFLPLGHIFLKTVRKLNSTSFHCCSDDLENLESSLANLRNRLETEKKAVLKLQDQLEDRKEQQKDEEQAFEDATFCCHFLLLLI